MILEGKGFEAATEAYMATAQSRLPQALNYSPGTRPFRSAWETTIKAADEANDPGRFTAFIGYEWSSNPGGNLHRNVIFRDDGAFARQVEPLTTIPPMGTSDPRGLWEWMQAYENKTGGDVLAIAHNGNLSNGLMFPMIEPVDGKPIDLATQRLGRNGSRSSRPLRSRVSASRIPSSRATTKWLATRFGTRAIST
jgi:hypothetical protein